MKKILLATILCSLPLTAIFGKSSCPKGHIECPSKCGMCVDKDENGTCDYTQSNIEPQKTIAKTPENRKQPTGDVKQKNKISAQKTKNKKTSAKAPKTLKKKYRLLPMAISLLLLYILSIILYKKKFLSTRTHFKIWNSALLLSFLISGLLGIFLVIMINYGLRIQLPFNIIRWHTEAGIAMFMICLFHLHWHWGYICNMLKRLK